MTHAPRHQVASAWEAGALSSGFLYAFSLIPLFFEILPCAQSFLKGLSLRGNKRSSRPSFVPQSYHGIDPHGPPRRKITG
jgi:hypothetical protein